MSDTRNETSEIEGLLPHRKPFLFVDEVAPAEGGRITARYVFTEKEFFFAGHFPRYPVVPGVILIETMAQAGGAGMRKAGSLGGDALFFLASVDKVKFRRQVRPARRFGWKSRTCGSRRKQSSSPVKPLWEKSLPLKRNGCA